MDNRIPDSCIPYDEQTFDASLSFEYTKENCFKSFLDQLAEAKVQLGPVYFRLLKELAEESNQTPENLLESLILSEDFLRHKKWNDDTLRYENCKCDNPDCQREV